MSRLTMTHQINCGEAAFWKLFFDKEFATQLHGEALGHPTYEILEQSDTGTAITRKVFFEPRITLPGPVAKLLGAGFRQTEEGRFDKATKVWSAKLIPSTQADTFTQGYTLRVEPSGAHQVKRIVEATLESRMIGVGGLMETAFERQMRQEGDISAAFMNQHLQTAK